LARLEVERARFERELQARERHLRGYFQTNLIGMAAFDRQGRIIEVNDYLCRLFGYSREDMLRTDWRAATHPEDIPAEEVLQANLVMGEIPSYSLRKRFVQTDGTPIPVDVFIASVRDDAGRIEYTVGLLRDVREEVAARAALQASERRFREIAEMSGDWLWETDIDGRLSYVSPNAERALRMPRDRLLGQSILEIMAPGEAARLGPTMLDIERRRTPFRDIEHLLLRGDGSVACFLTTGRPRYDEDGRYQGFRGLDVDITERKQAEEARRESEARFRDIAGISADWIWELDSEGRYTYVSPGIESSLGYRPEEMLGKRFDAFTLPEHAKEYGRRFGTRLEAFREVELSLVRKDGVPRDFLASGTVRLDADGKLLGYRGVN
ncbi:MAG: PAS domain S-box protein, partial [Gammaproteobacteria bacterium]